MGRAAAAVPPQADNRSDPTLPCTTVPVRRACSPAVTSSWPRHLALRRLLLVRRNSYQARLARNRLHSVSNRLSRAAASFAPPNHRSLCFSPRFVAALCYEGLLPICCELGGGTGLYVLLPKLHAERCVLSFDALHVPKKVRKRARRYVLTCGHAFDAVLDGCIRQHGESWLYPPLQAALRALSVSPVGCDGSSPASSSSAEADSGEVAAVDAVSGASAVSHRPHSGGGSGEVPTGGDLSRCSNAERSEEPQRPQPSRPQSPPRPQQPQQQQHSSPGGGASKQSGNAPSVSAPVATAGSGGVRALSFELWRDGELVAGELGCAVGASYTSFSGFHAEDGAGTAQLAMTASLLRASGFAFWDLGQEHAYKLAMGAAMVPRPAFLAALHEARAARPAAADTLDARLRDAGGRVDERVLQFSA